MRNKKQKQDWWGTVIRLLGTVIICTSLFILFCILYKSQELNNWLAIVPALIANILALIGLWGIKNQQRTLEHQNFDSSFFQLLGFHNSIVNSMQIPSSVNNNKHVGRECFRYMIKFFRDGTQGSLDGARDAFWMGMDDSDRTRQWIMEKISQGFEEFLKTYQPYLGYYFQHLYSVIEFVDESDLIKKDKKVNYTNLIRAQLSSHELELLFYNGIRKEEKKLRDLITKYGMLKDIKFGGFVHETYRRLYNEGAYRNQSDI